MSSVYGIWGSGPSDVYVVTRDLTPPQPCKLATAVHYDGVSWTPVPIALGGACDCTSAGYPYGSSFDTVWGSSASDVYFAGSCLGSLVFHFDSATWQKVDFPAALENDYWKSVWGSGPSDIYAIAQTSILHYDGTDWTATTSLEREAIWGASSSDIYAVGSMQYGNILHYDGNAWSPMKSGTSEDLDGVWGSGASDVYAVGGDTILHYDGSSWSAQSSGTTNYYLGAVWGSGPNDVYVVGCPSDWHDHTGVLLHRAGRGSF
jgi:hypothetical protein